jgi:di/tricarboxylate transporter
MTFEQIAILLLLAAMLGLFVWEKLRYDVVAVIGLLAAVFLGLVPREEAFTGLGHPAVITVAMILIITRSLRRTGLIEGMNVVLNYYKLPRSLQTMLLCTMCAMLSAFMNNVGALALMLPVALQFAEENKRSPSELLMPLAFASLLGGLVTLIGTPPNVIIGTYRQNLRGDSFAMFDFAPVGLVLCVVGILFMSIIGWRLLPKRRGQVDDDTPMMRINDYIAEARLPQGNALSGKPIHVLEEMAKGDVNVLGLVRGKHTLLAPASFEMLHEGDILILEGAADALQALLVKSGLQASDGGRTLVMADLTSDDVAMMEVVVTPQSHAEGVSAQGLRLHNRYGVNLLAVARHGRSMVERLGRIRLRAGDVLLLQGRKDILREAIPTLGVMPLAGREHTARNTKTTPWPLLYFLGAILMTTFGIVPPHLAFVCVVVLLVVTQQMNLRDIYDSIEWPVIVLLAAMMPVGDALLTSGTTSLISNSIVGFIDYVPIWLLLALLMVVTMTLSDVINNAATAVLMAPIAASIAQSLGLSVDPFLMTVAIGASSSFLTPIGHQSNVLVMGPGGYKFSDYWRLGLPLELLILVISIPMILWIWPL